MLIPRKEKKKFIKICMRVLAIMWYPKHCSIYSDQTNDPLTADQSNTVSSGADPGYHPPLCNPSTELEHQRLASDRSVQ